MLKLYITHTQGDGSFFNPFAIYSMYALQASSGTVTKKSEVVFLTSATTVSSFVLNLKISILAPR